MDNKNKKISLLEFCDKHPIVTLLIADTLICGIVNVVGYCATRNSTNMNVPKLNNTK